MHHGHCGCCRQLPYVYQCHSLAKRQHRSMVHWRRRL
jgi:hypothetical protein